MAASALAERAACAAMFWAKPERRDPDAIRGAVAGLSETDLADVRRLLRGHEIPALPDDELVARMLELSTKARATGVKVMPPGEVKSVATIAAAPDAARGTFTGYAATWTHQGGPDRQGDVIVPGAFTEWVKQVNSGAIVIPIVAGGDTGHSDAPMAVVGHVTQAGQDQHGLWIEAAMSGDADAQQLREKMKSGALTGLSIGYRPGRERYITMADGAAARELDQVDVFHIALTGIPANPSARISAAKGAGVSLPARVVTVGQDIADGAARRDPDRERIRREDAMLAAADWPPPSIDRESRLALIRGAAASKATRLASDDGHQAERDRWEAANRYSHDLSEWMAANR